MALLWNGPPQQGCDGQCSQDALCGFWEAGAHEEGEQIEKSGPRGVYAFRREYGTLCDRRRRVKGRVATQIDVDELDYVLW